MSTEDNRPAPDVAAAAARVLRQSLGHEVRLDDGEPLRERSTVFRFNLLDGPSDAPRRVVVKTVRGWEPYDPDSTEPYSSAARLFNDWAGAQFLQEVASDGSIGPRFYGGDRAIGLVVLEDLGTGEGLDHLLLGADPSAAEAGLVEIAAALGRMHALTAGREPEYNRIRDALGPHIPDETATYEWMREGLQSAAQSLDVALPPGVDDDLRHLSAVTRDPGPFLVYSHGDPCPDNWLRVGSRLLLLDFEIGGFRHALSDGVYGRIHFPTCWCVNRMPDELPLRMEQTYRDELARGCPAAADDTLFSHAVAEACVRWALNMCRFPPLATLLEQDREWGISTVRQRHILRFPIVERTTAEFGHLEALGAVFGAMGAELSALWAEDVEPMPVYPAFRASTQEGGPGTASGT